MPEETNQTQFSQESPLFTPEPMSPQIEVPVDASQPWFKQRKVLLMGGITLIGLFLLLSLVILRPAPPKTQLFESETRPEPMTQVAPQQLKINELRDELELADPATQELPFPAVNMELAIPDDRDLR